MLRSCKKIINSLLLVLATIPLAACSLGSDIHFYSDQNWRVDGELKYYDTLSSVNAQIIDLANQVLQANSLEPIEELPAELDEKPFVEALLREMVAHYGTKQIDAGWELLSDDPVDGVVYSLYASGRSWKSFEELIPGQITVEPSPDNKTLKLVMEFGQENVLASAFIQESIRIYGREIISTNAPVVRNGYAQWPNPDRIEIELVPETPFARVWGQIPWTVVIFVIGVLLVGGVGYWLYRYYVYG
jgi:hypothetical protein